MLLIALQLGFAGLSLASHAVPDRMIIAQLAIDVQQGRLGPDYDHNPLGGLRDGFTECIAATIGVDPTNPSAASRAIRSPQHGDCHRTIQAITAWDKGSPAPTIEYWRYWHGYTTLSRPAIAFGGLLGARMAVALALAAAAAWFVWAFSRRIGLIPAILLLTPLAVAGDLVFSPTAFPHGLSLAVALTGAAAVLRWGNRTRWPVLALAAGSAYNFVDLLTNPPLALLWCLLAVAVLGYPRASVRSNLVRISVAGTCWLIGWTATWVMRWILTMPAVGMRTVVSDISHQAAVRSSYGDGAPRFDHSFGMQTLRNVGAWLELTPTAYLAPVVLLFAVLSVGLLILRDRAAVAALVPLLLVTLLVPAWYEVLRNHSSQHGFFVYRALPGAFGVLAAVAYLATHRLVSLRRG